MKLQFIKMSLSITTEPYILYPYATQCLVHINGEQIDVICNFLKSTARQSEIVISWYTRVPRKDVFPLDILYHILSRFLSLPELAFLSHYLLTYPRYYALPWFLMSTRGHTLYVKRLNNVHFAFRLVIHLDDLK